MPADRNRFAALLTPKVLIIGAVVVAIAAVLAYVFISREAAAAVGGGGGGLLGLARKATQRKRSGAKEARGATEDANEAGKDAADVLNVLGDKEADAVGGKEADANDAAAHKGGGGNTLISLMLWMGLAGMTATCLLASTGCAAIDWNKAVTTHVAPPVPEIIEEPAIVQGHTLDCPRYVLTEDGEWHASAWFASGPTLELDVSGTMLPGYDRFQLIPTPITTMDATLLPEGGLGCTFIPVAPNVYSYYLKLHRAWGPRVAREAAWQEYAANVTESYGALQEGADEYVKGKAQEQRIAGVIVAGVVGVAAAILGGKIGWDLHVALGP